VTVAPQASDAVNGGTAGANFIVPHGASALFVTDAAGNFWPFFLTPSAATGWAVAAGTSDAITAAYTPSNSALVDGMLLGFRASAANTTSTPTFNPDSLGANAITYDGGSPVQPGAIPGALSECLVRYNLANTRWELLNPAIPPVPSLTISLASLSSVTLQPWQARFPILEFTGLLTGNCTVNVPATSGRWIVRNATTGSYTVVLKPTGGSSSQQITQNFDRILWTDGVNTYSAVDDPLNFSGIVVTEESFVSAGAWTTTIPAGVYGIQYLVIGGGGGGGGTTNCSGTQASAAPGGNGAPRSSGTLTVTPGGTLSGNIGAAGTAGVANGANGGTGGSTTLIFGATTITVPGGHGAQTAPAATPPFLISPPVTTNLGNGSALNDGEQSGQSGWALLSNIAYGGAGGGPGGGGATQSTNAAGAGATSYGGGGGGGNTIASGSGQNGGAGGGGAVFIWYLGGT
jgi:hypothetical protein